MSELKCYIVRDLLPLYADHICSEQTAEDIRQHMQSCESCRRLCESMQTELPVEHAAELEEKKVLRHFQKNLLGIMGALFVTTVCCLLNFRNAWLGGPAQIGNLFVSAGYILFWSMFAFKSRNYEPFVNVSLAVSAAALLSSGTGFAAVTDGGGGFAAAFLSFFTAVPFYGFRYFLEWKEVYGIALMLSLAWVIYSYAMKYSLARTQSVDTQRKGGLHVKKRAILTAAFLLSLAPMLLPQYGGHRGVQEIRGVINLLNPIGVLSVFLYLLGVWGIYRKRIANRILELAGAACMVASELYEFMTWHYLTVTGKISLSKSFQLAYPEFYLGLAVSIALLLVICFEKRIFKEE